MVTLAMVSNNCDLTVLNEQLNIASLSAGTYVLKLTATVGTQEVPVVTQAFQL